MCKAKTASGQAKRISDIREEQLKIEDELKRLEYEYPENEELQQYIKLLNRTVELEEEEKEVKDMLTESMSREELKSIESGLISVTYVAPTIVRKVNLDKFTADYGPETEEYKKYVDETKRTDYVKIIEVKDKKTKTKKTKIVE